MEQEAKPGVSAHVAAVGTSDHERRSPNSRMGGRFREIILSFLVMTVPMLAFSALLLGLIYHYRIVRNPFPSDSLRFDQDQDAASAIYVGISATTLITVASWSSTVAPILVGFVLTLLSYPVAGSLLRAGQGGRPEGLPTNFQLSLMLRMLCSGGPGSFWHWISYTLGWRGRRQSQPAVLKRMTGMLCVGILLSIVVFIADTWLHFTTKTTIFTQVSPNPIPSNHSFSLLPNCTDNPTPFSGLSECTLNPAASVTFIMDGSTTLQVLNNVSDTTMVHSINRDGTEYAYLGTTPQPQLSAIDYTATTWAVSTACTPVTRKCMDRSRFFGAGTPFKCPFAFQGDLSSAQAGGGPWQMAYFTNSSATSNFTQSTSIPNPYYFSIAAALNEAVGSHNNDDPEIETAIHGAQVFALFCNATVYDLEYTVINGSLTRFVQSPSNSSTTTIIQGTQQFTNLGDSLLQQAASVAAFNANSAQKIADGIATAYSRVALSVAAGAFSPRAAVEAQLRREILVARVSKGPLAFLLLANLLFVVVGVALTGLALGALWRDKETAEVQARLSVAGVVGSAFEGVGARKGVESVEEMFEEKKGGPGGRLGISRTAEGGWAYSTWRPQGVGG